MNNLNINSIKPIIQKVKKEVIIDEIIPVFKEKIIEKKIINEVIEIIPKEEIIYVDEEIIEYKKIYNNVYEEEIEEMIIKKPIEKIKEIKKDKIIKKKIIKDIKLDKIVNRTLIKPIKKFEEKNNSVNFENNNDIKYSKNFKFRINNFNSENNKGKINIKDYNIDIKEKTIKREDYQIQEFNEISKEISKTININIPDYEINEILETIDFEKNEIIFWDENQNNSENNNTEKRIDLLKENLNLIKKTTEKNKEIILNKKILMPNVIESFNETVEIKEVERIIEKPIIKYKYIPIFKHKEIPIEINTYEEIPKILHKTNQINLKTLVYHNKISSDKKSLLLNLNKNHEYLKKNNLELTLSIQNLNKEIEFITSNLSPYLQENYEESIKNDINKLSKQLKNIKKEIITLKDNKNEIKKINIYNSNDINNLKKEIKIAEEINRKLKDINN